MKRLIILILFVIVGSFFITTDANAGTCQCASADYNIPLIDKGECDSCDNVVCPAQFKCLFYPDRQAGSAPVSVNIESMEKVGIKLNVPIGRVKWVSGFGEYIQLWYNFVIGGVGIIAVIVIMWGGFKWLTSRGNATVIGDAKERIWAAVIGLILVFLSYSILAIINPALINIRLPNLPGEAFEGDGGGSTGSAGTAQSTGGPRSRTLPDWVAESENWDELTGNVRLVREGDALLAELEARGQRPADLTVNSGYRGENSDSQHFLGNAFDVSWPNMTRSEANTLVENVNNINPDFTSIIEFGGAYGSSGNNVHFDLRQDPIHLN